MNITKIALATLILAGTASASLATEFDANLQNRYPAATAPRAFQTAPVGLYQGNTYVAPIQNYSLPPLRAGGVG
jgi:hypothetical protein